MATTNEKIESLKAMEDGSWVSFHFGKEYIGIVVKKESALREFNHMSEADLAKAYWEPVTL